MSSGRDEQAVFALDAHLTQFLKLAVEGLRIHDQSVADYAKTLVVEDARRNEPKNKLSVTYAYGMACVVPALVPGDEVEMRRKNIDNLALTFVTPLGAHNDDVFHVILSGNGIRTGARAGFQDSLERSRKYSEANIQAHTAMARCAPGAPSVTGHACSSRSVAESPVDHAGNVFLRRRADDSLCFDASLE